MAINGEGCCKKAPNNIFTNELCLAKAETNKPTQEQSFGPLENACVDGQAARERKT